MRRALNIPPWRTWSACRFTQTQSRSLFTKKTSASQHDNALRITIIGAPGSGKGTQSAKIEKDFGIPVVSTGTILRQKATESTPLGKKIKEVLTTGGFVDDLTMLEIIKQGITNLKNGWILDGYPRTPYQAVQLDELLKNLQQPLSVVFYLDVPEDVLLDRIRERWVHPASGRTYNTTYSPPKVPGKDDITGEPLMKRMDDNVDAMRMRIVNYRDATLPLVGYYKEAGLLVHVESPTSDVGYITIKQVLGELVSS